MEKEYLVPGSTPVRAVRAVHDPNRPDSQIRVETAVRLDPNNINREKIVLLPRELKWLYENVYMKIRRVPLVMDPPHADAPPQPAVQEKPESETKVIGGGGPSTPVTVQVERKKPGPKPKQPDTTQSGPKSE